MTSQRDGFCDQYRAYEFGPLKLSSFRHGPPGANAMDTKKTGKDCCLKPKSVAQRAREIFPLDGIFEIRHHAFVLPHLSPSKVADLPLKMKILALPGVILISSVSLGLAQQSPTPTKKMSKAQSRSRGFRISVSCRSRESDLASGTKGYLSGTNIIVFVDGKALTNEQAGGDQFIPN